jgi:hypothetical protein
MNEEGGEETSEGGSPVLAANKSCPNVQFSSEVNNIHVLVKLLRYEKWAGERALEEIYQRDSGEVDGSQSKPNKITKPRRADTSMHKLRW